MIKTCRSAWYLLIYFSLTIRLFSNSRELFERPYYAQKRRKGLFPAMCSLFHTTKGVTALVSEQAVFGPAVNFKAGVGQGGPREGRAYLWNNHNLVGHQQTQNQGLR